MSYSFLGETGAQSSGGNGVDTPSFDSSTADFIIAQLNTFNVLDTLPTDNKGSTVTKLTGTDNAGAGGVASQLFFFQGGTYGMGHVISYSHSGSFPSICVAWFKGSKSTPLDQQNVGNSQQPGLITPIEDNELIICGGGIGNTFSGLSIDSGFSIANQQPYLAGNALGGAIAYLIQTSKTSVNPTWNSTGNSVVATGIGSFKVGPVVAAKSLGSNYRSGARSNWSR